VVGKDIATVGGKRPSPCVFFSLSWFRLPMPVCGSCMLLTYTPSACHSKRSTSGACCTLYQLLQQCSGLLKVHSVEALGEPTVCLRQQLVGLGALALLLPQAVQAHGRPQLPRLRLPATGDGEGPLKLLFRLLLVGW